MWLKISPMVHLLKFWELADRSQFHACLRFLWARCIPFFSELQVFKDLRNEVVLKRGKGSFSCFNYERGRRALEADFKKAFDVTIDYCSPCSKSYKRLTNQRVCCVAHKEIRVDWHKRQTTGWSVGKKSCAIIVSSAFVHIFQKK